MKILQNDGIRKISKLSFSTPSSPSLKVQSKELTTNLLLSRINLRNNSAQNISSLKDSTFHQNDLKKKVERERFVSLTTQHFRSKRDVNVSSTRNRTEEENRRNRANEIQKDFLDLLNTVRELDQLGRLKRLYLTLLLNLLDLFDRSGLSDLCNDSIINIKYDDEYKVWNNFSIFYKNKVYDYTEYRVLNDSIKICNSTDNFVKSIWIFRSLPSVMMKIMTFFNSCTVTSSTVTLHHGQYTVLKDFRVSILVAKQVITRHDYVVIGGQPIICKEKLNKKTVYLIHEIILVCASLLSYICLSLLFVVYGMLPELRTLPGLNLMSLSFSFLLWQTWAIAAFSLAFREIEMNSVLCAWEGITLLFISFCIFTNSAVNMYHVKKTFCCNTLATSREKKWKTFLKYSFFSWGIPVTSMIVCILLEKLDVSRFSVNVYGYCVGDQPDLLRIFYGLSFFLLFVYIIESFCTSVYRLRQKFKASNSIAQASNNARSRNSLIVSLKLFSATAITFWLPVIIAVATDPNVHVKTALFTLTQLTGFYIGVAFVFTKKNYKLLKKKCFRAKTKPSDENVAP